MSEEKIITRIEKNRNEEICFRIFNFRKKDYFDIRTYVNVIGEIDKKPTKKGVSFKLEQIDEVLSAINKVKEFIENEMNCQTKTKESKGGE